MGQVTGKGDGKVRAEICERMRREPITDGSRDRLPSGGRGKARKSVGTEYVQLRDGNIYVGPSRVTIDSMVINWRNGRTPEQIHESFPTVPLANVYGATAYYLEHRDEIEISGYVRVRRSTSASGWRIRLRGLNGTP